MPGSGRSSPARADGLAPFGVVEPAVTHARKLPFLPEPTKPILAGRERRNLVGKRSINWLSISSRVCRDVLLSWSGFVRQMTVLEKSFYSLRERVDPTVCEQ